MDPFYIPAKASRRAKPKPQRRDVRRDLHDAHVVSMRVRRAIRQLRR